MSLLSENVIPGNHGKTFETNATEHQDLIKIKESILNVIGVSDVIIDEEKFPTEITVHTADLVSVVEIQEAVKNHGFHALPKTLFGL